MVMLGNQNDTEDNVKNKHNKSTKLKKQ